MPFLFELDDQEKKKSAPTATAKRDPEVDEPLLFDIDPDEEGPPSGVDAAEFWASQYRKVKYLAARQAYLEKKGELIEREEVKDLLVSRMTEIRRGLEQIEQRLPPRLVNQELREIRHELQDAHRELLARLIRESEEMEEED